MASYKSASKQLQDFISEESEFYKSLIKEEVAKLHEFRAEQHRQLEELKANLFKNQIEKLKLKQKIQEARDKYIEILEKAQTERMNAIQEMDADSEKSTCEHRQRILKQEALNGEIQIQGQQRLGEAAEHTSQEMSRLTREMGALSITLGLHQHELLEALRKSIAHDDFKAAALNVAQMWAPVDRQFGIIEGEVMQIIKAINFELSFTTPDFSSYHSAVTGYSKVLRDLCVPNLKYSEIRLKCNNKLSDLSILVRNMENILKLHCQAAIVAEELETSLTDSRNLMRELFILNSEFSQTPDSEELFRAITDHTNSLLSEQNSEETPRIEEAKK